VCDPAPGARCSADTARELAAAKRAVASARRRFHAKPTDLTAALAVKKAQGELEEKQAAYDSSPRGQRELHEAISAAERRRNLTAAEKMASWSALELDALRTRLAVGRRTRIEQKKALAAAQGKTAAAASADVDKQLNRLRHPDAGYITHAPEGREAAVGFIVPGWEGRKARVSARELTAADLLGFYRNNRQLVARPGHYVTAWHNTQTGTVSIAVAITAPTAEIARSLSERMGQPLFYDAQAGHNVRAA